MNLHEKPVKAPKVTTGPLPGSRKVYAAPEGRADLRVPFREIVLGDGTPFRVSTAASTP